MGTERKWRECLEILRALTLATARGNDPTADELAYSTGYEVGQVLEAFITLRELRLICSGAEADRFHPTPFGRMCLKRAT